MKKKLFLTLLAVMALVCLFAISVCATDATEDPYAEYYNKEYIAIDKTPLDLYENEGDAHYPLAWFYNSESQTYESFRVGTEVIFAVNGGNTQIPKGVDFRENATVVFTDTTKTYTMENLILVNLQGTQTSMFSGNWSKLPIQAIYCNIYFSYVNGGTFSNNTSLTVFDLPKAHSATSATICGSFTKCTNLKEIYIPKSVCLLNSAFEYSGLEKVEFASDYDPKGYIGWQTTTDKGYWFNGCASLKTVILPTTSTHTYIGAKTFNSCTSLEEIVIPSCFTSIGEAAFEKCTALTELTIPEGVTTLGNCVAKNAGIKSLTLPTTLTTLNGSENFWGCPMEEIIGLGDTQLTSIPKYCFRGYTKYQGETLVLPNTLETIGYQCLADMGKDSKKLKAVYLGANVTTVDTQAFTNFSAEAIYMPATITSFTTASNLYDASSIKYVFLVGDNTTALNAAWTGSTTVSYEKYSNSPADYTSGKYIVYGLNLCETFYDEVHATEAIDGNPCQEKCSRCELIILLANPQHVNVWVFTNEEGEAASILATMIATEKCEHCGTVNATEKIETIFTTTGYSFNTEDAGVYHKTKVNKDALAKYAELTGNKDSYDFGIVAGLAADKDGNEIAGDLIAVENGNISLKNEATTVVGLFANTEYSIVEIKLVGVQAGTPVYCGVFAVVGNNVTYVCDKNEDSIATPYTMQ